jgi:hypothetical protein
MNLSALRLLLLALPLAACSQTEQAIPEFRTVTIDLREPSPRLADGAGGVPPPERKPYAAAAAPSDAQEAATGPQVASSGSPRWIPDFGRLTDCPDGVLCHAFAN